jgi:tRNA (adenine57-N1/adenine58-N1)-methyltransferase catalytic subunit
LFGVCWVQGLNEKKPKVTPSRKEVSWRNQTLTNQQIAEGDNILLYIDVRRTYMIKVQAGQTFHTHKGYIKFDDLIGKPYGSNYKSSLGINFTVLKPQLTDYILKSQRNTQIIYAKDAALIVIFSGIGPGSKVVESGTGTGALTTALAHYVQPTGKIFSYDIREEGLKAAEKNLKRAGLADFVELKLKDVVAGIDERDVDAVVLDLAVPWLVVPQAYEALKPSGTIVSFSPTIDQVVKTVEVLHEYNFVSIETFECIMRGMQIERGKTRPQTLMTGHTGYITHARKVTKPPVEQTTEPAPQPEPAAENTQAETENAEPEPEPTENIE